jgi:hypothetical protein
MTTLTQVGPPGSVGGVAVPAATTTSGETGDASSLLPVPVCLSGDTITQLAMLMTQSDLQDQRSSTILEDAANHAAAADDAARIAQMMDKAKQDRAEALVTGIGEVAGGSFSVLGAVLPWSNTADPGGRGWPGVLNGAAKVAPGVGTILSAQFKAEVDVDDAQAARYEAASSADVRVYNSAQAAAQADADAVSKIAQYLQAILQTEAATRLKAAGG